MQALEITDHSMAGWSGYAQQFGFVPDPMILRTGEIFLNGTRGTGVLERHDLDVWKALQQNIGGLLDFFDILVTRDNIPLINYEDTFDRRKTLAPLDQMLPDRMQKVEIKNNVYSTIKKGALLSLVEVDLQHLQNFGNFASELDAFRYEWEPELNVADADPDITAARDKFDRIDPNTKQAARFLLGGLIFSGFAQASRSTHYIQPKRARFFLGLTAAPELAGDYSNYREDSIFATAEARLAGTKATVSNAEPLPPVLPYLLGQGEPADVRELLARVIAFRTSREGQIYRQVVEDIRADGVQARRADDAVKHAREEALAFLAPDTKLQVDRSRSLDVSLSAETVGLPVKIGAKTSFKLGVPAWLRVWWNDEAPFGGIHKTLRRMWMAADSYNNLSDKLARIWARS